jgi:Uma2 family endonuclease
MFETILAELGENRSSRLSYSNGTLEIMVPCMEYEVNKVLISDLVKILLEELELEFWPLGSTTFKNAKIAQGLEADACFYSNRHIGEDINNFMNRADTRTASMI